MDSEASRVKELSLFADGSDGTKIDIGRELDWVHPGMTSRRRLFCYYEAMRSIDGKASLAECARRAGFSSKNPQKAAIQAQHLLEKAEIAEEIANLRRQIEQKAIKSNIDTAFTAEVARLAKCMAFDVTSLYRDEIVETPEGEVSTIRAKPIEDLTDEQRAMVEGVEIRGGVANYKVQAKSEAGKEVAELWARLHANDTVGGYDIEATAAAVDGAAVRVRAKIPALFTPAAAPSYED